MPVAGSGAVMDELLTPAQSPTHALPKRRNGKAQSCEPCRKAKVSCDHVLPKCGRCLKKGLAALCNYHPAPMTRQDGVAAHSIAKNRKSVSSPSTMAVDTDASKLLLLLSQQRAGAVEGTEAGPSHEFLGPTSYTAIFRENQASIGLDLWNSNEPGPPDSVNREVAARETTFFDKANRALFALPEESLCDRLIERYYSVSDAVLHQPSTIFCLRSLWATWGETLRERDPQKMGQMARKLLSTPRIPMRACRTSADWLQSFSGENLSFEIIGTFLAVFGLGLMTIPEWDPLFDSNNDGGLAKRQFARRLGEASEDCLDICSTKAIANEPLVWLCYSLQIYQSQYNGDNDGYLWRKAGYVATAITSLGMHRAGNTDSAPFMVAELRRRTFAAAYISDKQLATFTGRPPRLSRRYSHCQLPLDLSDEQLMAEGEELERHIKSLDENGWSTGEKWHYVTMLRGFMLFAMIRDEVLELCLGPATDMSPARRNELKHRSEETYDSLPARLRFSESESDIMPIGPMLAVTVMMRLEFLLNRFLLERIPGDDSHENRQNLINTADAMLEKIILLQRHRDRLTDFITGLTWGIVYCGIPAAGVLIVELLKQHRSPSRYRLHLSLTRSEIVQHLSIFVFCLGTVRPTEGNYKICLHMQKVVQKILDQVLQPPDDTANLGTPASSMNHSLPDVDIPAAMGPIDDPEFMDWLNSVDWAKGPWMDSFG